MLKRILYLGLDPARYQTNGRVTHWPIIQIVPRPLTDPVLHQALRAFPLYTHVVITSKSTVSILHAHLASLGLAFLWADKPTLAVGRATAAHLEAFGITQVSVAHEETGEGIIRELHSLSLEQAHLFLPRSSRARALIEVFLARRQIQHCVCELYDPQPRPPGPLPVLEEFDELVFTSPSTVEAFWELFGRPPPPHLALRTIGPITARYLEEKLGGRR